jgi:YVTN family beta-propeller protein
MTSSEDQIKASTVSGNPRPPWERRKNGKLHAWTRSLSMSRLVPPTVLAVTLVAVVGPHTATLMVDPAATPWSVPIAYVADVTTNTPGPPITVGNGPDPIAITPNGGTAYVANLYSGNVTPIRTVTNTPGRVITVGAGPLAIAITPNGETAYVANDVSGTVTPISTATNMPRPAIRVGKDPNSIAITPNGETAYVANLLSGTVIPIHI